LGHSLDSRITIYAPAEIREGLEEQKKHLRETLIVSQVLLNDPGSAPQDCYPAQDLEGVRIAVEPARGEKCARCWTYSEELGQDPDHPRACPRCTRILHELQGGE
ncbi:MAG: zinc finger domain-containing protein, partial [Desulfonatronovibrionaceae bacterium]